MIKSVGLAYLLLIVPAVVSWIEGLKLGKEILVSGIRSLVQIGIMASFLIYFFKFNMALNLILIGLMIIAGAFISSERGRGIPLGYPIAVLSLLVAIIPAALVLIPTGALKLLPPIIVPIAGMLIGNGTKAISLVYDRSLGILRDYQEVIEAAFLDGADYLQASKFLLREIVRIALIPQIDGLKILGVVHIPGTMAGLLIAGASPVEAAAYQLTIVYALASVSILAAFISANLSVFFILKARYERIFGQTSV